MGVSKCADSNKRIHDRPEQEACRDFYELAFNQHKPGVDPSPGCLWRIRRSSSCVLQTFADATRHFPIIIEGPHQGNLRGDNFLLVAALEGPKQFLLGISQHRRDHVEPWKIGVIFNVHNRRVPRNREAARLALSCASPVFRTELGSQSPSVGISSALRRQQQPIPELDNLLDTIGIDDFDAGQRSRATLDIDIARPADHMV